MWSFKFSFFKTSNQLVFTWECICSMSTGLLSSTGFMCIAHKVPVISWDWLLLLSILILSATVSSSVVPFVFVCLFFLSGRPRVWLQFQRLLRVPEPQQDWRDPIAEQNFKPFENQVGEGSQEHLDWESVPQIHTHKPCHSIKLEIICYELSLWHKVTRTAGWDV